MGGLGNAGNAMGNFVISPITTELYNLIKKIEIVV
jgi:hypothetical protein